MDCAQIRQLLGGGDPGRRPAGPAVEEHLADCPACRALAADQGALAAALARADAPSTYVAPSFDALAAELEHERNGWATWRSLPGRTRWVLAGLALLLPAGLALARMRSNLLGYPPFRFGLELGALLVAALLASAIWLRPLHRPRLGGGTVFLVLAIALVLPFVLAALPAASGASALAGRAAAAALTCLALGTAVAVPTALLLGALERHPTGPGHVLTLVAGALAALVGLAIHCPITDRGHLLAGHAPIVVLLPLAGLLASRLLRRRPGPHSSR